MCKYMGLHLGLQDMSELMASLLTTVLAEVLPGVLFVRWVQREFEDLLAVLIFSPVGGNKRLPTDRREVGKCRVIYS